MSDSTRKRPKQFTTLTQTAPCPACGAPVAFHSVTSVMSVCDYCQTTVVRDGEAFKDQGKQSLTIEDYSPLQIGSAGTYKGKGFTLIGRVQMAYEEGTWSEWRIQFDNGKTGWLSEALGEYSLSGEAEDSDLPAYEDLQVNDRVHYRGNDYTITDRRAATVIGCEGELPRISLSGESVYVMDARYKRQFITLDYADRGAAQSPVVFRGIATSLEALRMHNLKDEQQLNADSNLTDDSEELGKLDCPNCGYALPYVAGMTKCLMCPACRSEIQMTGDKAELLQMHSLSQTRQMTLFLGDKARIYEADIASVSSTCLNDCHSAPSIDKYHDYVIIGMMELEEVGEDATWTEYLLYSLTDGFLWLSEEEEGWFAARVLNELPEVEKGKLIFREKTWKPRYGAYRNKVLYAAGAFNWQVSAGDAMQLKDYHCGKDVITSEQNKEEITYTLATPVAAENIGQWFDRAVDSEQAPEERETVKFAKNERRRSNITTIIFILFVLFFGMPFILGSCSYFLSSSGSSSYYHSSGHSGFTSSGSHK